MHERLTIAIVTDVRGSVCQSVCLSCGLNMRQRVQYTPRAVCAGSFSAAFAKCFWPRVVFEMHVSFSFSAFACL